MKDSPWPGYMTAEDVTTGIDDPINPRHYKSLTPEPITAIEGWNLTYNLGTVVAYIARAGLKGERIEDLRKAAWHLQREIERGEVEKS